MNKKSTSLLVSALLMGASGAFATDINNQTPGDLATLLGDSPESITSLKISGHIDVRDLLTVANLPALVSLDLSEAEIESFIPDKPILQLQEGDFAEDYLPAGIFFGKKLQTLTLPRTLTKIGDYALSGNNFGSIDLPSGLQSIGNYAFYDCDGLTSVTLPPTIVAIGNYSFAGCDALTKVNMGVSNLKSLGDYAFRNDLVLKEVVLPYTLTSLSDGSFAGCKALEEIVLPNSLNNIGAHAFSGSGIKTVEMPSSVKNVGDFAFSNTDMLTDATLPKSGTELGDGVFYYAKALENVNTDVILSLPDYTFAGDESLKYASSQLFEILSEVGDYALMDNKSVESVVLSPYLTYLGDGAFEGMDNLKNIDAQALEDRIPELGENVFAGLNQKGITLTVADSTGDAWRAAPQWNEFKIDEPTTIIETPSDSPENIRAWFDFSDLKITAPEEIDSVAVYLTNGSKVFQVSPYSTQTVIDTSDFTERMYIVEVVMKDTRKVFKLLR